VAFRNGVCLPFVPPSSNVLRGDVRTHRRHQSGVRRRRRGGGLTVYDGDLYFIANNIAHGSNNELWKWNGSAVSQAAEIRPGNDGSGINSLTVHDGKLYFSARDDDSTLELWSYDPVAGAQEVPDNSPAWNPQTHAELISYGGDLYFRATDFSTVGTELGKYNGTTQAVIDIVPGTGTSYPQGFILYNGALHFLANGGDGAGAPGPGSTRRTSPAPPWPARARRRCR